MKESMIQVDEWSRTPELHIQAGGLQRRSLESFMRSVADANGKAPMEEGRTTVPMHKTIEKFQDGAEVPNGEYCYSVDMLHLFD